MKLGGVGSLVHELYLSVLLNILESDMSVIIHTYTCTSYSSSSISSSIEERLELSRSYWSVAIRF